MTEFLKNNPIALRHCVLYEFLRKHPAEWTYHVFCNTVGRDVIEHEDVQLWFKQFRQGRLDGEDYNEPIADMRDVFRSDKYALRAAVLFETLKSKNDKFGFDCQHRFYPLTCYQANRSFVTFEKVCKVIGDDLMEYREFDFWFYRFLNGEFDLNFERDKDKKIYELMDMPLDVMEIIVEQLDFYDRLALAKTCRSLHLFVQDQKVLHHSLELRIHMNTARVSFGRCLFFASHAVYQNSYNGCVKQFKGNETLFRGVSYWNKALLDFKSIIRNPKLYLDTLIVYFDINDIMMGYGDIESEVIDELETVLKSANQLNVKKFIFCASSVEPLLKSQQYLKPGYLTTLHIFIDFPSEYGMDEVVKMEQWKQAKCLVTRRLCFSGPLRHFYHFNVFNVSRNGISVEDVRQMKEVLFNSSDFEECSFFFLNPIDTSAIKREFSDAFRGNTHHYPIPNSTKYFEIKVDEEKLEISRKKT